MQDIYTFISTRDGDKLVKFHADVTSIVTVPDLVTEVGSMPKLKPHYVLHYGGELEHKSLLGNITSLIKETAILPIVFLIEMLFY